MLTRTRVHAILFVAGIGIILLLSLAYALFFIHPVAAAPARHHHHLYVLGNGDTINEVFMSDKTLMGAFDLIGRDLVGHRWYRITTNLTGEDGHCTVDDIGALNNTVVSTDAEGRFVRHVTVEDCDQNNYKISIRGPYLCTGCVEDGAPGVLVSSQSTRSYSTILDLDAP